MLLKSGAVMSAVICTTMKMRLTNVVGLPFQWDGFVLHAILTIAAEAKQSLAVMKMHHHSQYQRKNQKRLVSYG